MFNAYFAKTILGDFFSEEKGQILELLIQSCREGHLCLRNTDSISWPPSVVQEGGALFPKAPIVKQGDRYYLQRNWVYETYLLEQILRLKNQPLCEAFAVTDSSLLPEQKAAVEYASRHYFTVLCGGPGTGKTYTAGMIVKQLSCRLKRPYRVILTAPTGKAALHLESSMPSLDPYVTCSAFTLHRLLKLKPKETRLFSPKRIDADLVIVDEASMIDAPLFCHLLEAIGEGTRLVLMGDPNQLPPIETGSCFSEIAESFGIFLKRCMRTSAPLLHNAAVAILDGDEEAFFSSTVVSENWDLDILYQKLSPIITDTRPDPILCLKHISFLRILNALRQGPFGTEAVNQKLLEKMDASCKRGQWWAIPILVTENAPHLNLYNGSYGILIGQKQGSIQLYQGIAYFPEIGESTLPAFEVSFNLSIHKAQGSEFEEVIVLLPEGSENFGKEALYTAATRAKKHWEVIGKRETVSQMFLKRSRKISGFMDRYTQNSYNI